MPFPKLGMYYEDARKRVKRISKLDAPNKQLKYNLMNSIKYQAQLHEGKDAVKEMDYELNYDSCLKPRHGYSKRFADRFDLIKWSSG